MSRAKGNLSLQELLETDTEVSEFHVAAAKDTVLVAAIDGGGIISYQRKDGSLVHTLNSPEGFDRKLHQLGIETESRKRSAPL